MANVFASLRHRLRSRGRREPYVRIDSDAPLNYHSDQERIIRKELWEVDMLKVVEALKTTTSVVLAGGAVVLLARRKYLWGSLAAIGFVAQRFLLRPGNTEAIDVERYALKAERGDYGKLEVIPFR